MKYLSCYLHFDYLIQDTRGGTTMGRKEDGEEVEQEDI